MSYCFAEVATLVDEVKEAGYYHATFDASSQGNGVSLYRMMAESFHAVRKLVVVEETLRSKRFSTHG